MLSPLPTCWKIIFYYVVLGFRHFSVGSVVLYPCKNYYLKEGKRTEHLDWKEKLLSLPPPTPLPVSFSLFPAPLSHLHLHLFISLSGCRIIMDYHVEE